MKRIDYSKLHADKKNGDTFYNDELHVYWSEKDLVPSISVTTLIHQFDPFDEFFWSRYKALEALLPEDFSDLKPILLDTKKFNESILEDYNIELSDFQNKVDEILGEWEQKREVACVRGTHIHKEYELKTLKQDYSDLSEYDIPNFLDSPNLKVVTNNIIPEGNAVLPELLLSRISDDGKLRIAGQADLVIVLGNEFYILDFKTNKKIDTKSYFDRKKKRSEKLLFPLNHLDQCNYNVYTVQLSTYAWMIEKNNPKLKCKGLYLLHHDHSDKLTTYELDYCKKDVERMLVYYVKQQEYKKFKEKNTPLKFD